jgi:hypothetical protein
VVQVLQRQRRAARSRNQWGCDMAGLGLLLGGLAGAGRGAAQIGAEGERQAFERERMRLDEERAARIDELRRTRDRAAGLKMGQEIDAAAAGASDQAAADAINARFGSSMTAADAQVLRGNEEARKAYGLLGSTRQSDLEARATAAERLGYLDAARETRGQLQAEIGNQRNLNLDEDSKRRLDLQEKRQQAIDEYNQRRENRLDRLADSQLAFQKARANKEDNRADQMAEREQRAATVAAMKGAEADVRQIQKELADPLLAEEQKRVLQDQLNVARSDARRFRSALGGAGLEGSQAPAKPFNPGDYALGGNKPASAPRQDAPAAARPAPAPAERQSPTAMATAGLDRAINDTVRALTAAGNRGDKAEAQRLNELLQEQQRARARL